MCGIVGYIGDKFVDSLLVAGLERLEYRGYDSAGPEVGVASTKAYTAELLAIFLLTIHWGMIRNSISPEKARKMIKEKGL